MRAPSGKDSAAADRGRPSRRLLVSVFVVLVLLNVAGLAWLGARLYPSGEAPEVVAVQPEGEVEADPRPVIVTRFSAPVVPPSDQPRAADGMLRIDPPIPGQALWIDEDQLVFHPSRDLPHGRTFRLELDQTIGALVRTRLEGPREFSFRTAPIRLERARQIGFSRNLQATLRLEFSAPVKPAWIRPHLKLLDSRGEQVYFHVSSRGSPERSSSIDVGCRAEEESLVVVFPALKETDSDEEPVAIVDDREPAELKVRLTHDFHVTHLQGSEVFRGSPELQITFNNPVEVEQKGEDDLSRQKLEAFFDVEPAVDFVAMLDDSRVTLEGDFQPGSRYTVTIRKGLRGVAGRVLPKDEVREVRFPDRRRNLVFADEGASLSSRGNLSVLLETANVPEVTIRPHRVHRNNLVHYVHMEWLKENFTRVLPPKTFQLPHRPNALQELAVDLRDLVGPDPVGVFFLQASCAGGYASRLVTVSDLGITARTSGEQIVVWTTSLRTAEPVPQARASLWTRTNQLIAETTTDGSGLARFSAPLSTEDGDPFVLTVSHGKDLSYLLLDRGRLSRADFDVGGRPYLREGYEAFLFTERGVYRPGDTVHLRALVAGPSTYNGPGDAVGDPTLTGLSAGGSSVLPEAEGSGIGDSGAPFVSESGLGSLPLEVEILRPDGKRFRLERASLRPSGALEVEIPVPSSAVTGRYRARLRLPGDDGSGGGEELGSVYFRVEEYFPNRLKTRVHLAGEDTSPRFRVGERADFRVEGDYVFGMPADGCAVEARWTLTARRFQPEGWEGYRFGELRPGSVWVVRDAEEATLDPQGQAPFSLEIPEVQTASALSLRFWAAVRDVSGRPVSASMTVPVDPGPHYLGLRFAGEGHPRAGERARFECVALRPDGELSELNAAELTLSRVRWASILKRSSRGYFRYESREEVREVLQERVVLSGGRGAFEYTFEEPGSYRLRIEEPAGSAVGELEFYAHRPGQGGWVASMERPERVELSLAGPAGRRGEMARVLVRSPFPGTLLLTTETDRIESARVLTLKENTIEVEVPVPDQAVGNFYVGVSVVRAVDPEGEWAAHRAYGLMPVPVDLSERKLELTLSAPTELLPAEAGVLRVHVASREGTPVQGAEVAVAMVDTGILALTGYTTPDPFGYFYAKRSHGVHLADNYATLLAEVPLELARSRPGGGDGGGGRLLNPVVARRVKSAVLWLGPLITGPDGSAVAEFELPRFTGELLCFAVASAGGRSFGSSEQSILVRAPFFLELGMPRFLAPGDSLLAPVQVFNRTGADGRASLTWTLDGLEGDLTPEAAGLALASYREGEKETPEASEVAPGAAPAESGNVLLELVDAGLEIPSGASERVHFPLKAAWRVGKATARLSGSLGEDSFYEEVELPVRPPSPRVHRLESGSITSNQPLEIQPRNDYVDGTSRYRLALSKFPIVELAGSLRYLIRYPYGCLEQTTSKVFPLVYLRDLIDRLELAEERTGGGTQEAGIRLVRPEDLGEGVDDIDTFVMAGIERILDMQSLSGWMSMWPGGRSPWRWGTLYSTHFLVEARTAGYPVPEVELEAVLEYIRTEVVHSRRGSGNANTIERAYGLFILALAESADLDAMDALRELCAAERQVAEETGPPKPSAQGYTHVGTSRVVRNSRPSFQASSPGARSKSISRTARCFLAAAYIRVGKVEVARSLLGDGLPPAPPRDSGGLLRSPARQTAVLLSTLLDADPSSPLVGTLVGRLKDHRVEGRWRTTQENAFALLALGKYARVLASDSGERTVEVRFGTRESRTLRQSEDRIFECEDIGSDPVQVVVEGGGTLFYSWSEEGVPLRGTVEEKDSGIKVRRAYLNARGQPLDPGNIRQGDVVIVKLSLHTSKSLENIAVTDLLPAGLEIENTALDGKSTPIKLPEPKSDSGSFLLSPQYVSPRDDRMILFCNHHVPQKEGVYYYVCRAVTRGEFVLPPVKAEAMYQPELQSIHGAGTCLVR